MPQAGCRPLFRLLLAGWSTAALVFATAAAQVVTYDLAADWSNVANPNGPWQLNKAPGVPFGTGEPDWWGNATGQFAWADDPFPQLAHVPVWMLVADSQLAGFASAGSVVVHTAESTRTGTEFSSVVWTSPAAGTAVIAGGAWMRKNFDRTQRWELRHNATSLSHGDLLFTDTFTEASPFSFAAGSGGPAALTVTLQAGDRIELLVYRLSNATPGHLVGVDLAISFTPVPEPLTPILTLAGLGLMLAAGRQHGHRLKAR